MPALSATFCIVKAWTPSCRMTVITAWMMLWRVSSLAVSRTSLLYARRFLIRVAAIIDGTHSDTN